MRGQRVIRYHKFGLIFEPNTMGRERGLITAGVIVNAYGWKDALNQAERLFDLDRVRFIDHPSNDGVATAYVDSDGAEVIVGQVTAARAS